MYEIKKKRFFLFNFCVFLQFKNRDCVSQHPQLKLFPYQWGLLGTKNISTSNKWHLSHAAAYNRFEMKENHKTIKKTKQSKGKYPKQKYQQIQ